MTDTTYTRPGCPGASAQRVYEALSRQAEAWAAGAAGERAVGRVLDRSRRVAALHDRAWPARRANLDHVAVGPWGVLVIDAKAHSGPLELVDRGSFLRPSLGIYLGGRDRSDLLGAARRQADLVASLLDASVRLAPVPVAPVLCFTGADWRLPARWVDIDGVTVTHLGSLARLVRRRGGLSRSQIAAVARLLDDALPPRVS